MLNNKQKAYVIAVDMGYGHQRAAYPLRKLASKGKIINANNYAGIPKADREIWQQSRKVYEFFSRFKKVPLVGELAWDLFDQFQKIEPFYPKRDLSKPTIQLSSTFSLMKRKQWGKNLIDKLAANPLPIISTFFIPAFMAEMYKYPGEIYCVATDTDISRAWAPLKPNRSRIKYLVPNHRVEERLQMYGVRPENIYVTGFPIPCELIGTCNKSIARKNLGHRLFNVDPKKVYITNYKETIEKQLGTSNFPAKKDHPLTLMFAVGGAGAQRELGIDIVRSLKQRIKKHEIGIILVASIPNEVNQYFKRELRNLGLSDALKKKHIRIVFSQTKDGYFHNFSHALKNTDILWTKPSELSFYTALGLPIIMSQSIGSQEVFNRTWLKTIGSGVKQENAAYTDQWLFDWLDSGWFAEAAMQGFLEASACGAENIRKVVFHRPEETTEIRKILHF